MIGRSKYKVRIDPQGIANRTVDNITFHSVKEKNHYLSLKLLERYGKITGLVLQKRFDLIVNEKKVCAWIADFTYFELDGTYMVVDVKGYKTPEYRIKKRLFEALHSPLTITEI